MDDLDDIDIDTDVDNKNLSHSTLYSLAYCIISDISQCSPYDLTIMMLSRKETSRLYLLLCIGGFIYQVEQICVMYFKFETTTHISIVIEASHETPLVALCA